MNNKKSQKYKQIIITILLVLTILIGMIMSNTDENNKPNEYDKNAFYYNMVIVAII